MSRTIIALTIPFFTVALCSSAGANNAAEGKKHFKAGTALIKVDDFEGAVAQLEISYRLNPHKSALFNLANCYKALHQYGRALHAFGQLLDRHGQQLSAEMRLGTTQSIQQLESLVAKVQIKVHQPGATIHFNDEHKAVSPQRQPFVVGPGTHKLEVLLEGFETHSSRVKVVAREDQTVAISLLPKTGHLKIPAPSLVEGETEALAMEPSKFTHVFSPLTWVGIGTTAVLGITTGVLWGTWSQKSDEYHEANDLVQQHGPNESVSDDLLNTRNDAASSASKLGGFAMATSIATGVFLVGSAISLFIDLKNSKEAPTPQGNTLVCAPGTITMTF